MSESSLENNNSVSPQLTELADLLGKKSVRVTFKLHPAAIELLSLLASQLGIKQKSLFDYLMEDEEALRAMAAAPPPDTSLKQQRIQKTVVVSQRSLVTLEAVSQRSPASRDDLIERSIQRLLPVLEKERTRQRKRAAALSKIANHFEQGNALLNEIKKLVGEEDVIVQSLVSVISAYANAYTKIEKRVEQGKRLSDFSIDALKRDQDAQ
jgi:hypothetical protein